MSWTKVVVAVWVMALMLVGGCTTQRKADFVVTREPVGPAVVGFGACMNPYLYGHPNWPGEVNEGNVGKLEAEVKGLRPQFVRIFFLSGWWENDTDPVVAKGKPGMRESLLRTVRLAQEAGAKVLLQYWYDPKRYVDPEDVARRFARAVAEMRTRYGLTAVQFVTMQNEPNDDNKDITSEQYVRLYRGLDRAMREAGIRGQVQIVGGDLVSVNQAKWFEMLGKELAPVLDGYSIHAYWGYWDTAKLQRRIRETRQQVDALPAEQRRPLYVTEFGVQGKRPKPNVEPGFYEDGRVVTEVPAACAQVGWFMMEALNNGFAGTIQWDMYEAWYDRKMGYGVIGAVEKGFPEKPGYGLLRLFTEPTASEARAVRIIVREPNRGVVAAALRGGTGEVATFVLNTGGAGRDVVIGGLRPAREVRVRVWNQAGDGRLGERTPVRVDHDGNAVLNVPAHAVVRLDG